MITTASTSVNGSLVTLIVTLTESNVGLASLSALVDWGDGSTTAIPRQTKVNDTVTASLSHPYAKLGFYVIQVTGQNYRSPSPDIHVQIINISLGKPAVRTIDRGILRGPVIPRDDDRWRFDIQSDLKVLASNVTCILLTRTGERLMEPSFGTRLNQLVFEPDTSVLNLLVEDEVTRALSKFEPRVTISSLKVERTQSTRSVEVKADLIVDDATLSIGVTF